MVVGKCRECFLKASQERGFFKVRWRRKGIERTEEREGLEEKMIVEAGRWRHLTTG